MAGDLITTDQALGAVQAISRLARSRLAWTTAEARSLAGDEPVATLEAAKSDLLGAFAPVPPANSAQHAEWRKAIGARLDSLAAKIAPTMSVAQGSAWRKASTDALADLPAMIGLTATKRALHRPIAFISEVDGVIREIAAEITAERREAIERIARLLAALERVNEPALPAPVEDVDPASTAEAIDRVADPDLKRILRGIARTAGWLPDQDDQEGKEAA